MTELLGHVENPSAKIQHTFVLQTSPGCCAICGSGQDPNGFVDTGLDFEFWGRVFFCPQCVEQIAGVFGFIHPKVVEDLQGERDLATLELHQANDRITHLESVLGGLSVLGLNIPVVSTGIIYDMDPPEGEKLPTEESPESIFSPVQPSSESGEQIDGQSTETGKSPRKQRHLNI